MTNVKFYSGTSVPTISNLPKGGIYFNTSNKNIYLNNEGTLVTYHAMMNSDDAKVIKLSIGTVDSANTPDYSIIGGSNDNGMLRGVLGDTIANSITVNPPTSSAQYTISIGNGTEVASIGSNAIGALSHAGVKGFYWEDIEAISDDNFPGSTYRFRIASTRKNFYTTASGTLLNIAIAAIEAAVPGYEVITETEYLDGARITEFGWNVGDTLSFINDNQYVACATITTIDAAGYIYVDNLPFTSSNYIPKSIAGQDVYIFKPDDKTVFACYKKLEVEKTIGNQTVTNTRWYPRNGEIELGWAATTFGFENLTTGAGAISVGLNNWQAGNFGATFGRDNIGGYANLVSGGWNKSTGFHSGLIGRNLTSHGHYNFMTNQNNTIEDGTHNIVGGSNNVHVQGNGNIEGGNNNRIEHSGYSLIEGNDHVIYGDRVVVGGTGHVIQLSEGGSKSNYNLVTCRMNTLTGSGYNAVSGEYNNLTLSNFNNVSGRENTLKGITYSVIGGSQNIIGKDSNKFNNGIVVGTCNTLAQSKTVENTAVFGSNHYVERPGCLIAGVGHRTSADYQTMLGYNSVYDSGAALIIGNDGKNSITVGRDGTRSGVSTDAVTVEYLTTRGPSFEFGTTFGGTSIAYGDGKYVAINGTKVAYSTDGKAWIELAGNYNASNYTFSKVVYGNGRFVILDNSERFLSISSTDMSYDIGHSPTSYANSTSTYSLSAAGSKFFAVFHENHSAEPGDVTNMIESSDGITWRRASMPVLESIAYYDGIYVGSTGVTNTNAVLYRSTDLNTWENIAKTYVGGKVKSIDTGFIIYSYYSNRTATSTDGITWTFYKNVETGLKDVVLADGKEVFIYADSDIGGVTYGKEQFVAVYKSGYTATSLDGQTWKAVTQDGFVQNGVNVTESIVAFLNIDTLKARVSDLEYRLLHPEISIGLTYRLTSRNSSYEVTGIGTCTDTDLIIPEQYMGLPVTGIGGSAFSNCSGLTSITIPDSVTSIGRFAFSNCSGLTSIVIPDSVTSIGDDAFYYCSKLTSITISNSVTSIGPYVFENCSSLTSVTIPDGVTSIGNNAFEGCSSLTSVTIPDSVTSIGFYAFYNCSSLTSVTIPDGVTSIGDHTFRYCRQLTSIVIPDSVTSIGSYAFMECSNLTSITIPDSVTRINGWAFYYCSSLTSIVIPDGMTSIGYRVFEGCSSLTSIVIPDGVTSIDSHAFEDCSSLTSVTFNGTPNEILTAFDGCSKLTTINVPWAEGEVAYAPWGATNATINYNYTGLTTLIFHIDETGDATDTNVGIFTFTTETTDPQFLISSDGGVCVMGFGENVSGSFGNIETGEHSKTISVWGYCDGASTSEGGEIVYHSETVYHLTAGETYELWAVAYV